MQVDTEKTGGTQNPHGLSISIEATLKGKKGSLSCLGKEFSLFTSILCALVYLVLVIKPHVTFMYSLLCKRLFFCLILCHKHRLFIIEELRRSKFER